MANDTWNLYITLQHWFIEHVSDKVWVQCVVGCLLVAVAFVIARMRCFKADSSGDDVDILPNDGWAILGMGFLFVVMYFNDFQPWHAVNGFSGFFAWIGLLFHWCWLSAPLLFIGVMVVQMLLYILKDTLNGDFDYMQTLKIVGGIWMRPILGMLLSFPLLNVGLMLTSGISAPLFVGIFFLAALLMPSSNKWGEVTDRDGNVWEVWRW